MISMVYTKFTMNIFFVTIVFAWCTLWLNKKLEPFITIITIMT